MKRKPLTILAVGLFVGVAYAFPVQDVDLAQVYTAFDCPQALGTTARAINDRGEIVGGCEDANGSHGFLLRRGHFTMIDVPGATITHASGINNRSEVVGEYFDGANVNHGFLLRNGRFTKIDPPGSVLGSARGIDDLGRIVGHYDKRDGTHRGYLRDSLGNFEDILYPGAVFTGPYSINNLKRIVGSYADASGVTHGFLFKNAVFTSIDVRGATSTRAAGINIFGHIVGLWADDPACIDCFTKAFLLTPRGLEKFRFPGALETTAYGINAQGQIVGQYSGKDGVSHGFLRHRKDE